MYESQFISHLNPKKDFEEGVFLATEDKRVRGSPSGSRMKKEEIDFYRKYHTPSCGNLTSIKRNAIFIRTANGLPHELKKLEVCFELQKDGNNFITEAERSRRKNEERKIVDVVDLTSQTEIEIVHLNENHLDVLHYRAEGIIPVFVNPFECKLCQKFYPIKLKRHEKIMICDICENGVK